MSEETSRKRKSYPQRQAVGRVSFFHLIRVNEEGQCVYGPVGLVGVGGAGQTEMVRMGERVGEGKPAQEACTLAGAKAGE